MRGTLSRQDIGGLAIWSAKTGRNQFVALRDKLLIRRLDRFSQSRDARKPLFGLKFHRLEADFRNGIGRLGLGNIGYTFYSLRHGGATCSLLAGTPFNGIKTTGRWISDKSCHRYLNAGKALLLRVQIPSAAQDRITQLMNIWRNPSLGRSEAI